MADSPLKGLKPLWEQEKFLVARYFSFSHRVFKRLVLQTRKHNGLFEKRVKISRESDIMLLNIVSVFSTKISIIQKNTIIFRSTPNLMSANAF